MRNAVIIVAAGRGARLGATLPKQYLPLGEGTVLRRTTKAFLNHPRIDRVQIVISPGDASLYESAVGDLGLPEPVAGGASRQDSVLNGLEALAGHDVTHVLIHDAARPFVDEALIDELLDMLTRADAVLPVLPVIDSLKQVADGRVTGEVDRDTVARAQTPQGFHFARILEAHRAAAGLALTDDSAVADRHGMASVTVSGREDNFKITTARDLARARQMVAGAADDAAAILEDYRTGSGFDVHRFAPDRPLILCGIAVPHALGLAGHSDADVGLHAITDAVLGALADGDIGDHFPPDDPQWKGAESDRFLAFAARRVTDRGGRICNIDATLICEAPRIKPHRQAMRVRVAEIVGIPDNRVSIKATTTEKLGFTGRREGIAAQALVTIALPGAAA
ncbi:bifunctional 2-C-methyl-D-erythritol 4-phosphate cytidylyltransferase/2-C-methyl-D-erythritol 2,4-cyclodiphosphate synthase [Minwuia sp.]|uniref:bifunctional 2-C-methyl-D-erythritol 4-phosphate cytidylyltransferase/2-C-methyl-D-erythritol 2,4-cyclodiphosphate synthase n=1 Tax=Minwuia sp. TaxID=2493630 RepID=UPI003A9328F5